MSGGPFTAKVQSRYFTYRFSQIGGWRPQTKISRLSAIVPRGGKLVALLPPLLYRRCSARFCGFYTQCEPRYWAEHSFAVAPVGIPLKTLVGYVPSSTD